MLGRGTTSCEWWIPEIALVRIGFRNMNRWIQAKAGETIGRVAAVGGGSSLLGSLEYLDGM